MGKILVTNMPTCLTLCSSLVYVKGEELCVGVSTTPGEETKRTQHDTGWGETDTHWTKRPGIHIHLLLYVKNLNMGIYRHQTITTLSCVAACFESESSKEAGGRRRDRAGKDRWTEEKGSERHGGTDGTQGVLADQSHSTRNWAQVSVSFSVSKCVVHPICYSLCELMQDTQWQPVYHGTVCEWVRRRHHLLLLMTQTEWNCM